MLESKALRVWFGATILMCALSCGLALNAQEKPHSIAPAVDYRIGPGDVIQISVWEHPEVNRVVGVNREGSITLPLANT
jgi:protein involved in polysaccharide export with SLBB domain